MVLILDLKTIEQNGILYSIPWNIECINVFSLCLKIFTGCDENMALVTVPYLSQTTYKVNDN